LTWPFVSRAVFEDYKALTDKHEVRRVAELEALRSENMRLLALLEIAIRLKKPKAKKEAPSQEPVVAAAPVIPVEVQWPIEQRAGGDPFLRRHLNVYAQEQLAKGTTPEEIIHRIRNGDDDDEG
jgi:hypothetical protein